MAAEKTPSIITLTCLSKFNDPHQQTFKVYVENDIYVSDLKEKIKNDFPLAFSDVDVSNLILWKVEIPFNDEAKLKILENAYASRCSFNIESELGGKKLDGLKKYNYPTSYESIDIIVEKESGKNNAAISHILDKQPVDDKIEEISPNERIHGNEIIQMSTACVYTTTEKSDIIDSLLRQELGHVMHRNVDNFFDSIFPVTEKQSCIIDKIMGKCKQDGMWENEWRAWPKNGSLEKNFYQPCVYLMNHFIREYYVLNPVDFPPRTALIHAYCCPMRNRKEALSRKPDIVLVDDEHIQQKVGNDVFGQSSNMTKWCYIHVVGEIKRYSKNDNVTTNLELASYIREIFGSQPTRRFVLGFTLCGALMRVWLFDRSGAIGSRAFNIHNDPILFVRVVTGFATMEKFRLGYDPSIIDHPSSFGYIEIRKEDKEGSEKNMDGKQHPKNQIIERFVLVEKIFHRVVICGRATVCWKAYRLDQNGKRITDQEYIIKDSWRSTSRKPTEGDLLKKATIALKDIANPRVTNYYHHEDVSIFLNKVSPVYNKEPLSYCTDISDHKMIDDTFECIRKKLFLPVVSKDGDENISIPGGTQESLQDPKTSHVSHSTEMNSSSMNSINQASSPISTGSNSSTKVKKILPREPEYRIHTRLITSTCGKPIVYFRDHMELLVAFRDAIEGHRNLFQIAKILHRDISLYNIMIGRDGRGFIIDLDYAIENDLIKRNNDAQGHRTGTLPFMAIGILLQNEAHNFRHDLESFFYVLCWIYCEYEGPCGTLRSKECYRKDLSAWTIGSPENIGFVKTGMMKQFDFVVETFSPYFNSFIPFMRKFHKLLFKEEWKRHDVLYSKVLQVFLDEIERRRNDNLSTLFGNIELDE